MGGERRDTIKEDTPTVATRVEDEIPGRQMPASMCVSYSEFTFTRACSLGLI